jgi:long-chain acyl-CoA synthetase
MAILGAGAITIPIYPSNTSDDVAYILNHSEARVLILEDEQQCRKIADIQSQLPKLEKLILLNARPEQSSQEATSSIDAISLTALREAGKIEEGKNPTRFETYLREAEPKDVISVVYTSGTTGTPKGALITHDNMVSVMEDCVVALSAFSESGSEVILSFLPFSHILGKVESMMGYTFGWQQAFAENLDKLLINMKEIKPTILVSVPRTFEKASNKVQQSVNSASFIKKKLFHWAMAVGRKYYGSIWKKQLPAPRVVAEYLLAKQLVFNQITEAFGGRLGYVICGGAPLSRELGEFFQIAGIKILEGYGLTETCGPVSVNTPDNLRFGTVGRPLVEVSARVADDGEIEIRSRKLFAGYYKNPEKTQAAMNDGWFKTGDIGFIDDEGFIHITDRKRDIIVTSGGKNVAPQKIESLAQAHSWINQIIPIGDKRPYLVALLTLNREEVIQLASEKGILFSEYAELIKNQKIIMLTQHAVDEINSKLAQFETIKKFMVLPNEFTVASGELTPSLKVKRRVIEERYASQIQTLYEGNT